MKLHNHHLNGAIDISSSSSSSSSKRTAVSWLLLFAFCSINLWWFLAASEDGDGDGDGDGLHLFSSSIHSSNAAEVERATRNWCLMLANQNKSCDHTKGQWVRDFSAPLYTNETCKYIFLNQNCMTNGRPDRGYIYWRWKPNGCELPSFDPTLFLQLMRGKKILFIGDSIARNHQEALLCALSQVEEPSDVQDRQGIAAAWEFPSYNFVLSLAWSPFLVDYMQVEEGPWKIHVDKPDKLWTKCLSSYDVAIFSMTNWFFRTSSYYVNNEVVSSHDSNNATSIEFLHGMKLVWETIMKHLVDHYKGLAILRSVSVSHFDGNPWDKGGTCKKTQPYFDPDGKMELPWTPNEIFKIQNNELRKAIVLKGNASKPILKLLDVTYSSLLRPDGHPGVYRIQSSTEPKNDCVHWCMPGPIDMWNQLMFSDPDLMCMNMSKDPNS